MSRGFPGIPGNIQGLMKQAQKLQEQMAKVQEEAEQITCEGTAVGGMVKAVANGKNQLVSIAIDPQVVSASDVEMLQDLILAAVNEGLRKVQEATKSKLAGVTGGMNIPGLF